jgi:hypothetical protein
MEPLTILFFGGIAFVAGVITRSLFIAHRPPQVVYVTSEPLNERTGCLPFLVIAGLAALMLLAVSGVS